MVASGDSWFVVLPDHEAAAPAAAAVDPRVDQWVLHPSGRPWLLARADRQDVVVADTPVGELAVIGHYPVTAAELAGHAARLSALTDLDARLGGGRRTAGGRATATRRLPPDPLRDAVRGTLSQIVISRATTH